MNERSQRIIFLILQAILMLFFFAVMIHALIVNTDQPTSLLAKHFIPAALHLLVSFVAAVLLCFFYQSSSGAEAQVLPNLFFTITLSAVKLLPLHTSITHMFIVSPQVIAVIYQFSVLYTAFLFLVAGLLQQGVRSNRTGMYLILGAILTFFFAVIAPLSTNTLAFFTEARFTDTFYGAGLFTMAILAVINFVVIGLQERSKHTWFRCAAFITIIIGNNLVSLFQHVALNTIGIVLYILGIIALIMVTKTYRIWE